MNIPWFQVLALCAVSAAVMLSSACDEPTSNPPPPVPAAAAGHKPPGVPTKVFKQIKGIEQKHDAELERALNE